MTRTYWVSCCDSRPEGRQFLGVVIVEITEAEAAEIGAEPFPAGDPWIKAIARKMWRLECNPGGQLGIMDVTEHHAADPRVLADTPRHVVLGEAQLRTLGHLV